MSSRIRTIKPEFFLDTELAELPVEVRYFFIGLWTQADREGRMEDNPKRLKAQLMPWDSCDCEALLGALSPRFITRYEVQGRRYLQINTFARHQRPHVREADSAIPAPKGTAKAQPRQCLSTTKAMHGTLDKGKGMDNGNGERSMEPEGFAAFWEAYPRKESKKDALRAWDKLKPAAELQAAILADLKKRALSADWRKDGGKFIPHPASYLNGSRWEDQGIVLPQAAPVADALTAAHLAARGTA
jgi:hypothetical protein